MPSIYTDTGRARTLSDGDQINLTGTSFALADFISAVTQASQLTSLALSGTGEFVYFDRVDNDLMFGVATSSDGFAIQTLSAIAHIANLVTTDDGG